MERFWSKVNKTDGCWLWTACTDGRGYGLFQVRSRKSERAHRVSWGLCNGKIPEGMCVLHQCDNPICVRPDHLFLGTQLENIADRVKKGRTGKPNNKGTINGQHKLAEYQVLEMRKLRSIGLTYKEISEKFSIAQMTAYSAINGRTWKHA